MRLQLGAGTPFRIVLDVGGLYVAQSVIGGVMFTGLPAVMRQHGASLNDIAVVLLAILPWSFKFLWAPAVERFRVPPGEARRSRTVVGVVGAFALGGIVACAFIGPTATWPLLVAMMVASVASATVDIACDGHAIESLAEAERGWANTMQVGGAYLGAAIGAGIFLIIVDHLGWRLATLVMAAVLVMLALPFLTARDGGRVKPADHPPQSLRAAFRRAEVRSGLALVALYVMGQKWALVLIGPFLIDAKLGLSTVGSLNAIGTTSLGLLGALGGGYVLRRFGTFPVMTLALGAQVLIIAAFAFVAHDGAQTPLLLGALALAAAGTMALGFVALYSELMERSSLDQAGVDFTLFQSMDAIVSVIGWRLAGALGDAFGYAACFAAAAVIGLAALALLPMLARPAGSAQSRAI